MIDKKYFVVSDIHSFYDELISALSIAGYSKDNESHILIVNGDLFDRGAKSVSLYNFLMSIPEDRLILIQGNHELLILNMINSKRLPLKNDFFNGTVSTILHFAFDSDMNEEILRLYGELYSLVVNIELFSSSNLDYNEFISKLRNKWNSIISKVSNSKYAKFLKSDKWKNYVEIDNYIITHSFIPLRNPFNVEIYGNMNYEDYLFYDSEWRVNASFSEWTDAKWGCPWKQYKDGLFDREIEKGKTLVCGHWHTSDFYKHLDDESLSNTNDIYFGKNIIALDSGFIENKSDKPTKAPINVFVIKTKTRI